MAFLSFGDSGAADDENDANDELISLTSSRMNAIDVSDNATTTTTTTTATDNPAVMMTKVRHSRVSSLIARVQKQARAARRLADSTVSERYFVAQLLIVLCRACRLNC
jgi:hypothetical protein